MESRRSFIRKIALSTTAMAAVGNVVGKELDNSSPIIPTQQKISVFSKHFHWLNYDDMAMTAKEIGFDGIDLTVRPNGHVLPENVSTDLPRAVRAIRQRGLEVYSVTTAIDEADGKRTREILSVLRDQGIRYYRMNWFPYDQNKSVQENLVHMRTRMEKISRINQEFDVHGAYQNHSGTSFGASVWDLYESIKDLDPRYIGCQFDVRHATVEGGNSWVNDFNVIKAFIKTHNIKDFVWTKKDEKWQAQSVPLGEGMVDFKKYFELIKANSIVAPICIHYEYPLGGADEGAKEISITPEKLRQAMRNDLLKLQQWLS